MARTLQNAHGDVGCVTALGLGQRLDPFAGGHRQGDRVGGKARTDGQLFHINVRRVQHRPARPHGNHGQRVGHVLGGQRGAFQRVQRDVHAGAVAGANLFPDEQHRCFVALAFANHHHARDVQQVQLFAHGVHRRLVGGFFVAVADQLG